VDAIPAFLITLTLIPVLGLAMVHVIREMIMKNIDPVPGVIALGVLLGMLTLSITARSPAVAGATLVIVLSFGAFYPYAESMYARQIGREINVSRIDRAHEALSQRPENVAAWFALAEGLYRHGYQGHAIAIAEESLGRLSTHQDPTSNRSLRDLFKSEESALKYWKKGADPKLCRPLKCPLCGETNPPGPIACIKCGAPYLLELVRRGDQGRTFVGKLLLGWALLAGAIVGAAASGLMTTGWLQGALVAGCIAVAGGILWWLFRPARGDRTAAYEI
jgi:hypothetical protein